MILNEGDRILAVHRRLFETDSARYFVGIVDAYETGVARVSGYTWVREQFGGTMYRKDGIRTKILALTSGTLIVYRLEDDLDLSKISFENTQDGRLWITDGRGLRMDLSEQEYSPARRK